MIWLPIPSLNSSPSTLSLTAFLLYFLCIFLNMPDIFHLKELPLVPSLGNTLPSDIYLANTLTPLRYLLRHHLFKEIYSGTLFRTPVLISLFHLFSQKTYLLTYKCASLIYYNCSSFTASSQENVSSEDDV